MPHNPRPECKHCADVHDGFYGSYASPCPQHFEDGTERPAWLEAKALQAQQAELLKKQSEEALLSLATDAARWRELLNYIGGAMCELYGKPEFVIRGLHPSGNLMQGSVAEHFTRAIDAKIRAKSGK